MHIHTAGIRALLFVDCQQVLGLVFQTRAGDQDGNPFFRLASIFQLGGTSVFAPHALTDERQDDINYFKEFDVKEKRFTHHRII